MHDKEFFQLQAPHFLIEGRSRAGHETYFRVRDLGIGLDIGRGPDALLSLQHIFVTHLHIDHAAGIAFYAGQRRLQGLAAGIIYVPEEAAADVRALLAIHEKMTGAPFDVAIRGVAVGEEVRVSRGLLVRGHAAPHRVAARAWEFIEQRHHLRPELSGLDPAEIARRRHAGEVVDEDFRRSILFYTGDTDRGLLERSSAVFDAEVLMIECSFVADGHQERAARYRHIHVDDIAAFADRFRNELIVLTHFSRRYANDEIRETVRRRLPVVLHDRVRLGLPERWQRIDV